MQARTGTRRRIRAIPALHEEVTALVQHDILSPLEAITAATLNGARALGIGDQTGSIEVGKRANLVVLNGNPMNDIEAIRDVFATIFRGRVYRRAEYESTT